MDMTLGLYVRMYVCMYVCMYACMCVYVYVCRARVCVCGYVCMYAFMCVCVYVCMCVCVYVCMCMCVCVYVCMCVCVYVCCLTGQVDMHLEPASPASVMWMHIKLTNPNPYDIQAYWYAGGCMGVFRCICA